MTGWTGNNFSLVCNHTSIIAGEKNDDGAIIGIHDSDMNKFIIKQEFNIDYGSNFFTQLYNNGKLKFYDHNGHDMTISVVSEGTFPFHTGQGHAMIFNTNQGLLNKFTAKLISENISLTFSWDKNQHGVENLIYSIKYRYNGNINSVDTLRLYLKKTCYDLVSEDIPYTDMKINPFGFLVEKEYYDIIPKPESCSTLMTNYNIQTSGIVIGANIESHAFTLNKLGNSVETIVVDVDNLNKEISALAGEITQVSNELNTYIMTDVIFGFAEAGIGAISGIIASGSKGAFKMGEKTFAKAAEGGERGTVAIGEDFSRVSVEGELNVGKIKPKNGETAINIEGDITASGEASFSSFSTSESGSIATNTVRPVNNGRVNVEGELACTGTIKGDRWQSASSEGSSIEMSAEGISISGSCQFESEVSGNSALFDSFSTSEGGSIATNTVRPVSKVSYH